MKTLAGSVLGLWVTAAVLLGLSPAVHAEPYGWVISNSSTDPNQTSGTATSGLSTLYLWFACSQNDGMSAAELTLDPQGITILATTPRGNFLNAGGATELLLAVGGCPRGSSVAAELIVIDTMGSICLTTSSMNGILATVDCRDTGELWPTAWIGYSNDGSNPCSQGTLCHSASMREASLGEIKSGYKAR